MTTTSCARVEALIAARLDGVPTRTDDTDDHLLRCAECRAIASQDDIMSEQRPVFPAVDPEAYDLGRVLGQGGMGQIRIARDRRIGRIVAMKELLFVTPALTARFVREARLAASLQHPNIIPIYEVGCFGDGTPFYTMRLVEGRTLNHALVLADTLEARIELLPRVNAAADAIGFAHARGVVHRDLTPANILVGSFGETVVIDWGLAKDLRIDSERVAPKFQTGMTEAILTANGDVIGSPAYMPVEQATGDHTDERADVYALGAILYHLLTGAPPYVGNSHDAVLAQVRAAPPPVVKSRAKRAPADLAAIVDKAMARDARDRYATASELASDLRRYETELLVDAHRSRLLGWR
jgi:eukaryotic-like serine/threonine-protein kinase